jgi:hypothetical protein
MERAQARPLWLLIGAYPLRVIRLQIIVKNNEQIGLTVETCGILLSLVQSAVLPLRALNLFVLVLGRPPEARLRGDSFSFGPPSRRGVGDKGRTTCHAGYHCQPGLVIWRSLDTRRLLKLAQETSILGECRIVQPRAATWATSRTSTAIRERGKRRLPSPLAYPLRTSLPPYKG